MSAKIVTTCDGCGSLSRDDAFSPLGWMSVSLSMSGASLPVMYAHACSPVCAQIIGERVGVLANHLRDRFVEACETKEREAAQHRAYGKHMTRKASR